MTLYLILSGMALCLGLGGIALFKIRKATQEIDRLFKVNEQLQAEKTVAETQVKHHQVRKNNEEKSRNADRTSLIDRLHAQGDLRD